MKEEKINNLIIRKNKIYTKSKDKLQWYGERVLKERNYFLREWDPKKSKIAAAIRKGLRFDFKDKSILYLGCSTGTTVSHLADLTEKEILGVDVAPIVMREFLILTEKRKNVVPLLYDASKLPELKELKNKKYDVVFQDIATRDMINIFIENVKVFLKEKGTAMLSLKTRSIDSTISAKNVLEQAKNKLEKHFKIKKIYNLEPFEKEHYFLIIEK